MNLARKGSSVLACTFKTSKPVVVAAVVVVLVLVLIVVVVLASDFAVFCEYGFGALSVVVILFDLTCDDDPMAFIMFTAHGVTYKDPMLGQRRSDCCMCRLVSNDKRILLIFQCLRLLDKPLK